MNGEPLSNYRNFLLNSLAKYSEYDIFTIGYLEDPIGYIPDIEALNEGGYETDRSIKYFGLQHRFSHKIQEKIIKCFKSMQD